MEATRKECAPEPGAIQELEPMGWDYEPATDTNYRVYGDKEGTFWAFDDDDEPGTLCPCAYLSRWRR